MGATLSAEKNATKSVFGWTLDQVSELREKWATKLGAPFPLKKEQLVELLKSTSFGDADWNETEFLKDLWAKHAITTPEGVEQIDSLGLFSLLILLCHGDFDEKVELLRNMYDFNEDKHLQRNELGILVQTCSLALAREYGRGNSPPEVTNEWVDTAFENIDSNNDNKISDKEFEYYIRLQFNKDGKGQLDPKHLLYFFGSPQVC